ncbi:glycosyltransferase family 2 protein [Paenibacillus wynnii]|uniref:glycosyltransferase family 2 protein n=1 Tax=Paenibacillus wynnii TaxID=268407 RepID=UPI00279253EA|nr:glycosyltransferase involved in cell wall biosynthesis [Paenibacillus wynnii]
MITISLCLIVKDEQETLGRCLASVSDLVDEIIIVDTGSTDDTKDIARNYTEQIYDFTWIDDFSAARNYAFAQASKEYIFWSDADDVLQERDRLVKRSNGFRWIGDAHEYLEVNGNIMNSDIAVTHSGLHHDSNRNLYIYEQRLSAGETFSPRDLYYFANELLDHKRYERAILFMSSFSGQSKAGLRITSRHAANWPMVTMGWAKNKKA